MCKIPECNCVALTDGYKCLLLHSTACSECFPLNISLVSQTNLLPGTLIVTHTHLLITFNPQRLAPQQTHPHKIHPPPPFTSQHRTMFGSNHHTQREGVSWYCTVLVFNIEAVPGMTESMQTGAWPRSVKPKVFFPL